MKLGEENLEIKSSEERSNLKMLAAIENYIL